MFSLSGVSLQPTSYEDRDVMPQYCHAALPGQLQQPHFSRWGWSVLGRYFCRLSKMCRGPEAMNGVAAGLNPSGCWCIPWGLKWWERKHYPLGRRRLKNIAHVFHRKENWAFWNSVPTSCRKSKPEERPSSSSFLSYAPSPLLRFPEHR